MLASYFATAPTIGFSGSRHPLAESVAALHYAITAIPINTSVLVGCATGIDAIVREHIPNAKVFQASEFGTTRWSFAKRSTICVQAVSEASGLWVSFPSTACSAGLQPSPSSSRCFCGLGSGTWASLALAIGLGVRCLVFVPQSVEPPINWGLSPLDKSWVSYTSTAFQPTLF
jgi:hypothetical protein